MLILIIALLIAMVVGGFSVASKTDSELGIGTAMVGFLGLFVIATVAFFGCLKWEPNAQSLTGYVYQRQERYGYANYSLRFSQNAGTDAQPSFCTKAGSDEDKEIQQYVGTDTKVQISVPARSPQFDDFWSCDSYAKLDKVIKEDARNKEETSTQE